MGRPLEGIKVVELAMWAFVPSCGGILSDLGADVIKLEPPAGDPIRSLTTSASAPGAHGFTVSWEIYNRGKRSVTLDLNAEGASELLHKLLDKADVFLTSLLPPARRKLKVDVDDIVSRHPGIIYAIGSGYGSHGEEAAKGGYDFITFWSRGSVAAGVTPKTEPYPLQMPSGAFGDCISGSMLAGGVCAAIAKKAMTGEGSVVDGSLLASSMWAMQRNISAATLAGVEDIAKATRDQTGNPLVNTYRTADDRFVALCMLQSQRYWKDFCRVIDRPDLVDDPRFATGEKRTENVGECVAFLDELFASKPLAEWREILGRQTGPWDVIQKSGELVRDQQTVANQYMQDVDYGDGRSLKMVTAPIQFDRQPLKARRAPDLGAHNDEVLGELGLSEDEILDLKVAGVIY